MTPVAPETPQDHTPSRRRQFKMRLTDAEAAQLKSNAHSRELTQADYVRLTVFGQTAHLLPDASKLEDIARQLAGIGANINQCQKAINEARQSGTLTTAQFEAMGRVLDKSTRAFVEPLAELRAELKRLKPANDNHGERDAE